MVQDALQGSIVAVQGDSIPHQAEYYFDIISDHTVTIQNQITDNYLENNTAVQDHIAHSPITVTLSGLRGELVYVPSKFDKIDLSNIGLARYNTQANNFYNSVNTKVSPVINKLSPLNAILPSSSNITQLAKNVYNYTGQSLQRYNKVFSQYIGNRQQLETKLQEVFRKLRILRTNNTALTVETPYYTFSDMYIQSISLRQGNENFVTDIELTLKQLRFAEVTTTKVDEKVMAIYNAQARANQQNNGKTQGRKKSLAAQDYDSGKLFGALGLN